MFVSKKKFKVYNTTGTLIYNFEICWLQTLPEIRMDDFLDIRKLTQSHFHSCVSDLRVGCCRVFIPIINMMVVLNCDTVYMLHVYYNKPSVGVSYIQRPSKRQRKIPVLKFLSYFNYCGGSRLDFSLVNPCL